jgi:hypothetical protein
MRSGARIVGVIAAVAVLSLGGSAGAQRHAGGGFAGPNELTGQIGPSFGLTDNSPGGFKFANEYGYRLSNVTWFNVQLNFTLGGERGWSGWEWCYDPYGGRYRCGGWHGFSGDAIEVVAGVKLKWPRGRLLPYAKFGGGFAFSFWAGDHAGTAVVFRGGGGVKYYVLRQLAIGGEGVLSIGPSFMRDWTGHDTGVYAGLDLLGGVEWNF